jgi:hypothetical protein
MIHDDDEGRDDDFDLEFSDIPLEGESTFVEKIVLRATELLSNQSGLSGRARGRISVMLVRMRHWLLEKPERQRFADGSTGDDIELELADLPNFSPTRLDGLARVISRLHYKMRLWRIAIMVCTIALVLVLILSAVPQIRGLLFRQPPASSSASLIGRSPSYNSSAQIIEISQGNSTPFVVTPGSTVTDWLAGATPAPAPSNCPSRPNLDGLSGYGGPPIWVVGFDGGPAMLHFAPPAPVFDPVFPSGFAWTTSVTVQIQASYKQPVSLSGQNLDDGSLIYFDYNPDQGTESSSLTFDSLQTPSLPGFTPDGSILVWSANLYFSSSGCYVLHANWATGSWTMNFAAGQ